MTDEQRGSAVPADLRIGVLGLGNRARLAKLAHRPGEGSVVQWAADPDSRTHSRAIEWFGSGVHVAADHRRLLDAELDAVMVITPDHTHDDLAAEFLRAGISVYVEKPLAITLDGCDHVLRAAVESGSPLFVGHNLRHMPVIKKMHRLIADGAVGEVKAIWCRHFVGHGGDFYFKDWHADQRYTTSLLLQKGAHDIDAIHWLAGSYTRRVSAMGGLTVYGHITDRHSGANGSVLSKVSFDNWPPLSQVGLNPVVDVEDLEMVTMELRNGVFATYQQCQYTPDYWRNYTVIGTEGRLENFGDMQGEPVIRVWNTRSRYKPEGDAEVKVRLPSGGHGGADPEVVDDFLRFVREATTTLTSPLAARESVATAYLAAQSLRSDGAPCEVPLLDDALVAYFEAGQPGSAMKETQCR